MDDRAKWDKKYADAGKKVEAPSNVLTAIADLLPTDGEALDLAGGAGRHALWLAARGLNVTLVDVSPVGLAFASQSAEETGCSLTCVQRDLIAQSLPPGSWRLVLSCCFLHRPLLQHIAESLHAGGRFVMLQPTRTNRQRHKRPPERFLLNDGELPGLIRETGLTIIHEREGWLADGRHDALVVAEKPAAPTA